MQKLLYLIFFIQIAQASSQAPQTNSPKSPSMNSSSASKEIQEQMFSKGYGTILTDKNGSKTVTLNYAKKNSRGELDGRIIILKQTINSDGKADHVKASHDVKRYDGQSTVVVPLRLSTASKTKFENLKQLMFKCIKENDCGKRFASFNLSNETVSLIKTIPYKRIPVTSARFSK